MTHAPDGFHRIRSLEVHGGFVGSSRPEFASGLNCIIGGRGAGKIYLACALAHKACRAGYSVRYLRLPRLFSELTIARRNGRYQKLLASRAKIGWVALDDWATARGPRSSATICSRSSRTASAQPQNNL